MGMGNPMPTPAAAPVPAPAPLLDMDISAAVNEEKAERMLRIHSLHSSGDDAYIHTYIHKWS